MVALVPLGRNSLAGNTTMPMLYILQQLRSVHTPGATRFEKCGLGQLDLTSGYAWMALTQRVAYDQMNWHQYALFYLCSLPDGNGMGSLLVSPHACGLFQYDSNYETFYKIGSTTLVQSTLIAAGGPKYQVSYLLYHYVLSHPIWHALVSIPMAMRGLWIDHYWSLVMAVLCIPLTWRSLRILDAAMLAVTLPGWIMLAFYAATSANQWPDTG